MGIFSEGFKALIGAETDFTGQIKLFGAGGGGGHEAGGDHGKKAGGHDKASAKPKAGGDHGAAHP